MNAENDIWLSSRLDAGGAIIEAYPGEHEGTFGAEVHVAGGELPIAQGAAAIEAVMVKMMEGVETPAQFAEVQAAIVGRLANISSPTAPTEPPPAGEIRGEPAGAGSDGS